MEDVNGVAGADDLDDAAGVGDVVRVQEGGHGALRRLRPWSKIAVLVFDPQNNGPPRGMVAPAANPRHHVDSLFSDKYLWLSQPGYRKVLVSVVVSTLEADINLLRGARGMKCVIQPDALVCWAQISVPEA